MRLPATGPHTSHFFFLNLNLIRGAYYNEVLKALRYDMDRADQLAGLCGPWSKLLFPIVSF